MEFRHAEFYKGNYARVQRMRRKNTKRANELKERLVIERERLEDKFEELYEITVEEYQLNCDLIMNNSKMLKEVLEIRCSIIEQAKLALIAVSGLVSHYHPDVCDVIFNILLKNSCLVQSLQNSEFNNLTDRNFVSEEFSQNSTQKMSKFDSFSIHLSLSLQIMFRHINKKHFQLSFEAFFKDSLEYILNSKESKILSNHENVHLLKEIKEAINDQLKDTEDKVSKTSLIEVFNKYMSDKPVNVISNHKADCEALLKGVFSGGFTEEGLGSVNQKLVNCLNSLYED